MKRIAIVLLASIACLLAFAAIGSAQVVTNPTKIEYTVSPDHATLTKYIVGYFLPGATDPVQVADLAIATPIAGVVTQTINATPLGYGTYIAKLKSVAGAVSSDWSLPSNDFTRTPLPPALPPIVKK
jgi:hypothetical protein